MDQQTAIAALRAAGIENAAYEVRLLAERFGSELPREVVERRAAHYPLQYLLGEWGFFREIYEVNEHCLIPRSDTEILVERAVGLLPAGARFLDLCTGSGCVAISTLAARPDTTAVAVDLFEETLALAARNAKRNNVAERVSFYLADVRQGGAQAPFDGGFAAIVSNPPYIQNDVMRSLQPEVGFEPAAALCGGEDGLDFYRDILSGWRSLLAPDGFFLFEIGYDQADALGRLGADHGLRAEVTRDYGGQDRVVLLRP